MYILCVRRKKTVQCQTNVTKKNEFWCAVSLGQDLFDKTKIIINMCALFFWKRGLLKDLPFKVFSIKSGTIQEEVELFGVREFLTLIDIFCEGEYDFPELSSVKTIVDIGSNLGLSVLYFKSLNSNLVIHAFEPSPYVFPVLKKNLSGLSNIYLHNKALGDEMGNVRMQFNPGRSESGSVYNRGASFKGCWVEMESLAGFLTELDSTADVIKFDIEGAEYNMFSSFFSTFESKDLPRLCIGEFHGDLSGQSVSEFAQLFEKNGYVVQTKSLNPKKERYIVRAHITNYEAK